jgi:hypothetical protein
MSDVQLEYNDLKGSDSFRADVYRELFAKSSRQGLKKPLDQEEVIMSFMFFQNGASIRRGHAHSL